MGRRKQLSEGLKTLFTSSGRRSPNPGGSGAPNPTAPVQLSGLSSSASGSQAAISAPNQTASQTPTYTPDPALGEAIKRFTAGLTDKERSTFHEHSMISPHQLIDKVKKLDEDHKQGSLSRRLSPGIEKTLNAINRFMDCLSIMIQHSPEISALVVGGFKCILLLALGFFGFFERLASMLEHIESHLSYLCKYAEPIFQKSVVVQEALVKVYCDLLDFCVQTRRIFTDDEGEQSQSASFKVFLRLPWDPYETRLRDIQMRFSGNAEVVFRAAQVQGMIDEHTERQWVRLRAHMEDLKLKGEKRRAAFKWLSSVDFDDTHQRTFSLRFGNTGRWLLDDDSYTTWRDGAESRLLWCNGTPGTGKTVLCSLVLQTLFGQFRSSDDVGIAYAYCSYADPHDPATVIATFIKQLSRRKEHLPNELEKIFDIYHKDFRKPGFPELEQLFLAVVKGFSQVFVVLDGLDECNLKQRKELLPFIQKAVTRSGIVKLFVTSRKEADIERAFADVTTIQIEATKVDEDIKSYVGSELDRRLGDGSLKIKDPGLKKEILDALLSKAEGMFLWVGFQLDNICDQHSDYDIRKALQSLPETLDEMYERIILDIERREARRTLARRVLLWVAYAEQSLSQKQLAEAVAIKPGMKTLEDLDIHMVNGLEMLVTSCGNLVQVIPEDQDDLHNDGPVIRFVHYSVKEYLLSTAWDARSPRDGSILPELQLAHDEIAQHCLIYLLFAETEGDFPTSYRSFAIYAVKCWQKHARVLTSLSEDLWKLISEFIHKPNVVYKAEAIIGVPGHYEIGIRVDSGDIRFPPLLNACLLNLPLVLDRFKKELLDKDGTSKPEVGAIHCAVRADSLEAVQLLCSTSVVDVNALDPEGCAPLCYAESAGVAKLLLDLGADVAAQGENALRAAVWGSHREVVELLLDRGADVNGQCELHVLLVAAERASSDVVKLLLDRGADVNAQGGFYGNPLQTAIILHAEVVELLLERGADVNAQCGYYGSALQAAAFQGMKDTVELLLERGIDVNMQGGPYGNPLQAAAARRGSKEVVELLLERGADVNAQGGLCGSALQAAAHSITESKEMVELLLERGADVNAHGGEYGSPLQAAAHSYTMGKEVVELLLKGGADVNPQCGGYGGPLYGAATRGNKEVVELLLEWGADVDAQGGEYGSPLQAATHSHTANKEVVEMLLKGGADVNTQRGESGGPLYGAATRGDKEVVELLLEWGADVNAQGGFDGNALQAATGARSKEVAELLLNRGADVNAQGGYHGTALQCAARKSKDVAVLLLEHGADVNAQGGYYGSALQAAAWTGSKDMVELLLRAGADVNTQGGHYGNALQAAVYSSGVAELLLEWGADANTQSGGSEMHSIEVPTNS